MLILYMKTGCPYGKRVLDTAKELDVDLELKNIDDPRLEEELLQRGGKRQVPYLVDDERGIEMYESEAIKSYLHDHYAH